MLEPLGLTARVNPKKQSSFLPPKSQRFNSRFGCDPIKRLQVIYCHHAITMALINPVQNTHPCCQSLAEVDQQVDEESMC